MRQVLRTHGLALAVWVLLPLAGLLALWAAALGTLNQTYYPDATGIAGELLAGHSVGQTFIAQHDGLSAVDLQLATYARANPGDVVLHLRENVTNTLDLATVRVPAAAIANNAWHRFAFPPQPHSRGRAYYVELEAPSGAPGQTITAYWALQHGDPYPYGRATYDRAPLDGDLTFGLHYDPPPGALWADLARTIASQIPGRMLLGLAGAALAGLVALVLLLVGSVRGWFTGRAARRALLAVLLAAVALAHSLGYMIVVPPWQGPDEFAHYAYSALLAGGYGPTDGTAPARAARARIETGIEAAMDSRGFTRTVSWYPVPGGPAKGFIDQPGSSSLFWETRQPAVYYEAGAALLRLYAADPTTIPADVGLWLVRLTSVIWSLGVVLLAWGCAVLLAPGPRPRLLHVALPLTIALLPMRVFIDSMVNNDVLAELAVSLVVLCVVAWLTRRRPFGLAGLLWAVLGLVAIVVALRTKATTTAAVAPALGGAALLGACVLQSRAVARGRRAWLAAAAATLLGGAVLGAALLATGITTGPAALAWRLPDGSFAPRAADPAAHDGADVLQVTRAAPVNQLVDLPPAPGPRDLTLRVWARPAPGSPPGRVTLTLRPDSPPLTATTTGVLTWTTASAVWQPLTATVHLPTGLTQVRAQVSADAAAEVDDATLAAPGDPAGTSLGLRNGGMEQAAVVVRPGSVLDGILARLPAQFGAANILETALNPQGFDKAALTGSYLTDEFHSFWGWFGWLGLPEQLPGAQYTFWALVSLAGLAGWLLGWVLRPRWDARVRVFGLVTLLVFLVAQTVTVVRQMTLLAVANLRDFPQGRYLFVLIIPLTWLLLVGLGWALGRVPRRGRGLLAALGLQLLLWLALYALLVLLIPYYYGRF